MEFEAQDKTFVIFTKDPEDIHAIKTLPSFLYTFDPRNWFRPEKLSPRVKDLIYWESTWHSGATLIFGIFYIRCLIKLSFLCVAAYTIMAMLMQQVVIQFYSRIFKESEDFEPCYSDTDFSLNAENYGLVALRFAYNWNNVLNYLHDVFEIRSHMKTFKFSIVLWGFIYIGTYCNTLTLILLGYIAMFTLPKLYAIFTEYRNLTVQKSQTSFDQSGFYE